jgi:hypothetical protein
MLPGASALLGHLCSQCHRERAYHIATTQRYIRGDSRAKQNVVRMI